MIHDILFWFMIYCLCSSVLCMLHSFDGNLTFPWERDEYKLSNLIVDLLFAGSYLVLAILYGISVCIVECIVKPFAKLNFTIWKRKGNN